MIRAATVDDVPAIVAMLRNFHRDSVYRDAISLDEAHTAEALANIAESESGILLVADRKQVGIVGVICGVVGPHIFSSEPAAVELFWWVEPEYRGSGARLLIHFEIEAAKRGATLITMVSPGIDSVSSMYERRGFRAVEQSFVKGIPQ